MPYGRHEDDEDGEARLPGYAKALWAITLVFGMRMLAQLLPLALHAPRPLPSTWYAGSIGYWLMMWTQVPLLIVMITVAGRHSLGRVPRSGGLGRGLLMLGSGYSAIMATRLMIGLLDAAASDWFRESTSACFHLVLASFVLVLAAYHLNWIGGEAKPPARRRT